MKTPAHGLAAEVGFRMVDAALWIILYLLSGRLEFRQQGIVDSISFYRWSQIESFTWTQKPDTNTAILNLKLRGRHPILPAIRLKIEESRKADVDSVMRRFLSEWPSVASAHFPESEAATTSDPRW